MEKPEPFITKTEMARRHIQSMILGGAVGPGDRITTREVSNALGISETPIREAIRSLASEGWLNVQSHIGAVVQGLRIEQIREISALRGSICGLAIELGAPNFTKARLAEIDKNISDYGAALEARDYRRVLETNYDFHLLLCDNPQSPWCRRLLENMHGLMSAQRHGIAPNQLRLNEALEEHKRIRDMLRAANFAGAADMVKQHEKNTGDFLIEMIRERSEANGPGAPDTVSAAEG
ncbi:MAG: GntR family transcriptional regulator [Phyllobacteriaceae bacterium]|jgi:DNA-binding GntR family transcriptional regulator|nr:GntR family transcriptional regulator [Phyllobacteriaceae bacterium]